MIEEWISPTGRSHSPAHKRLPATQDSVLRVTRGPRRRVCGGAGRGRTRDAVRRPGRRCPLPWSVPAPAWPGRVASSKRWVLLQLPRRSSVCGLSVAGPTVVVGSWPSGGCPLRDKCARWSQKDRSRRRGNRSGTWHSPRRELFTAGTQWHTPADCLSKTLCLGLLTAP